MDLVDLLLEDEDFASGSGAGDRELRPILVNVRELEEAVLLHDVEAMKRLEAEFEANAAASGVQTDWKELVGEAMQVARWMIDGEYEKVLKSSKAGQWLLRKHDLEKEGLRTPDCGDFSTLMRMFVLRTSTYVVQGSGGESISAGMYQDAPLEEAEEDLEGVGKEEGEEGGEGGKVDVLGRRIQPLQHPESWRAVCVGWVGAAALQLHLRATSTGPEIEPEELERVYPLPYALAWLQEVAPAEAAAGIAIRQDATALMRARLEREAVASTPADAPLAPSSTSETETALAEIVEGGGDEDGEGGGEAGKEKGEEEGDDGLTKEEVLVARLSVPRSRFHTACLSALGGASGGMEVYEYVDVPHLLVTALAILRGVSGVGVEVGSGSADDGGVHDPVASEKGGIGVQVDVDDSRDVDRALRSFAVCRSAVPGIHWWGARAHGALYDALLDPGASIHTVTALAREHAHLAGRCWTPHVPSAYTVSDLFQRELVHTTLSETGIQGTREEEGKKEGGGGDGGEESKVEGDGEGGGLEEELEALAGEGRDKGGLSGILESTEPDAQVRKALVAARRGAPWARLSLRNWLELRGKSGDEEWRVYYATQVAAHLLLEWSVLQFKADLTASARTTVLLAKRDSGLQTRLTGRLGRRTKFQTFDVALLVLRARSLPPPPSTTFLRAATHAEDVAAAAKALPVIKTSDTDATTTILDHTDWKGERRDDKEEEGEVVEEGGKAEGGGSGGGGEGGEESGEEEEEEIVPDNLTWKQVSFSAAEWRKKLGGPPDSLEERKARHAALIAEEKRSRKRVKHVKDGPLSVLDQCILLGLCRDVAVSSASDGLLLREIEPYVTRVMDTPQDWTVHSAALLTRTTVDFASHRTRDRAILQRQALLDQQTKRFSIPLPTLAVGDADASTPERLASLPALLWPPAWHLKRGLADWYRQYGVLATAAKLYEELELWDDVISCTMALEKPRRAQKLILTRLRVAPTPRLWQLLGLVRDDDALLEKAWKLSGEKDAKTRLSQARRAFSRGEHAKATECLIDTLRIDPRSSGNWFLLGSCYMRQMPRESVESEEGRKAKITLLARASDAFRQAVRRDPTNGDAWANLGAAMARRSKWRAAAVAMERGLETKPADWRMWDNLVTASMHARAWSRSLHAMERVIQLRHSDPTNPVIDTSLLRSLVAIILRDAAEEDDGEGGDDTAGGGGEGGEEEEVEKGVVDCYGVRAREFLGQAKSVVRSACAAVNKWELWEMAADLQQMEEKRSGSGEDGSLEVAELLKKALRALQASHKDWARGRTNPDEKHSRSPAETMRLVVKLATRIASIIQRLGDEASKASTLVTLQAILKNVDVGETFTDAEEISAFRSVVDNFSKEME